MNFDEAHVRRIHYSNALMNLVIQAAKEGIVLRTIHEETSDKPKLPEGALDYTFTTSVSEVPAMHHNNFLGAASAVSAGNAFIVTQTTPKKKKGAVVDFSRKLEYYNPHPLAVKE